MDVILLPGNSADEDECYCGEICAPLESERFSNRVWFDDLKLLLATTGRIKR
jgi:hypothetical protein